MLQALAAQAPAAVATVFAMRFLIENLCIRVRKQQSDLSCLSPANDMASGRGDIHCRKVGEDGNLRLKKVKEVPISFGTYPVANCCRQCRRRPTQVIDIIDWWAREDSNLQPSGYEPLALTIELRARAHHVARGNEATVERWIFYLRRLSKNTACSPNRFQNHHGIFSRMRRPQALSATASSILAPDT